MLSRQTRQLSIRLRYALAVAVAGGVLLGAVPAAVAPKPAPDTMPLLTTIQSVRMLTRPGSARHLPFRLQGVITIFDPAQYKVYLQDGSWAIYAAQLEKLGHFHEGQRVEVSGVTESGRFAPILLVRAARVIREDRMPAPIAIRPGDLGAGKLDSRIVEVTGTVRSYATNQYGSGSLALFTSAGPISARILNPGHFNFGPLLGSVVRVRGPMGVTANQNGQLSAEFVVVDSPSSLEIVRRERQDPSAAPPIPIAGILQFQPVKADTQRVHIRGVVTLVWPGHHVVIQDSSGGVEARTSDRSVFPVGSLVDAVGFPAMGDYSPVLDFPRFTVLSSGKPLAPQAVSAVDAASGSRDYQLVKVRGTIVAEQHDRDRHVLWLESGGQTFSALLEGVPVHPRLEEMRIGSLLELTGVCVTKATTDLKEAAGFRLYLRSDDDVSLLRAAPWWNGERMLKILGGSALFIAVLILMVLSWNLILRNRVKRQTSLIHMRAEFERERNAVLEMVGRNEELEGILERIREIVGNQLPGCAVAIGLIDPRTQSASELERPMRFAKPIVSSTGQALGVVEIVPSSRRGSLVVDPELLDGVAKLAGLAIDHRNLHDQLLRQSREDALTGLANRMVFEDQLREAVASQSAANGRLACLFLDLDGFKQINDRMGHKAGDFVLRTIADRLRASIRGPDLAARVGGDEFCILMPSLEDSQQATALAERLLLCLEGPIEVESRLTQLSASIGIAIFPDHASDSLNLQRCADAAMYRVKRQGKAGYRLFGGDEEEVTAGASQIHLQRAS